MKINKRLVKTLIDKWNKNMRASNAYTREKERMGLTEEAKKFRVDY